MSLPNPAYLFPPDTDPTAQDPLPESFRYVPPIRPKNGSVFTTANGSVVQSSSRSSVGGSLISFKSPALTPAEFAILNAWYETPGNLGFQGYWGDSYNVHFKELVTTEINGCLFDVGGVFVVQCSITPPIYDCDSCLPPIEE